MKNYISVLSLGLLLFSMSILPAGKIGEHILDRCVGRIPGCGSSRSIQRYKDRCEEKNMRLAKKATRRIQHTKKLQSIRDRNYRLAWAGISVAGLAMITRVLYLLQNALQQDSTTST